MKFKPRQPTMPLETRPTAQQRFLNLLKRDILKLELADLDFGIYRILNYRRAQILSYLDETLPGRIAEWTQKLEQTSGKQLADSEADNCYYHLHTFFSRYWDDCDFIPRARRGGTAAYAVPYNGQDTHFHWATKGSHYASRAASCFPATPTWMPERKCALSSFSVSARLGRGVLPGLLDVAERRRSTGVGIYRTERAAASMAAGQVRSAGKDCPDVELLSAYLRICTERKFGSRVSQDSARLRWVKRAFSLDVSRPRRCLCRTTAGQVGVSASPISMRLFAQYPKHWHRVR